MAASKRNRTRVNDPESTRSRVLDASAALFQRKGYCATSMHDIIEAASVTSGALHHHYPTKKAIGLAVIRERVASMVKEAWIDPVVQAEDPLEGVGRAFGNIAGSLEEQSIVGCPLNNLALELAYAEPEFRIEIQAIFEQWRSAIATSFKKHASRAGVEASADELATFVIACYSGAMTLAKSSQSSKPMHDTLRLLMRNLAPALGPSSTTSARRH